MPPAKPKNVAKAAVKAKSAAAVKAALAAKPAAKTGKSAPTPKSTPTTGGIPLKQRTVWVLDMDSAQFKAARRRDAEALRAPEADRDGMQHAEGLFIDKAVQKWWT